MSKPTKVPGIPKPPASADRNTATLLTNLIEAVEIRLGRRGDPKDRAVTLRELIDSGLAKDFKASPWDPNNPNSGNRGFGPNEVIDTSEPPAPLNFQANAAYSQVNLSWDYPNYGNHSYAEIYGHDSDTIGDAQIIGASTGRGYADPIGSGASRYYWIRFVSQSNIIGPFNSGTGTLGTTAADVDHLLDVLTDAITESELATDLQTEIDKISGDINVAGSIAAQVAAEATLRASAVSGEAAARALAVSSEASARATAISNSADALQAQLNDLTGVAAWDSTESYSIDDKVRHDDKLWSAEAANSNSEPTYSNNASTNSDWELTGDYTSLASVTAGNSASITAINNVSSDSTSAAAVAIKGLQTTVADPTTGLSATAGALTSLSNAVNHTDTGLVATAGLITSLETAVFNDMTGVANWNEDTSYAVGDKVISGKKLYRATAASTDEEPPNSSYWDVDTLSSASAISELSTTLTDNYATADATNLLLAEKEDSGVAAGLINTSEATAATTYATATNLTNLESATFGNLTGLSAYDEDTTYAVGDRVTHGVGVLKKIYVATQASSASDKQAPTVPAYWDEDTLASQAVTNAALGGKETSGAAAQALQDSKTYTDINAASASEFSLLNAAVFEDVAGVDAWDSATAYAIGARIYFGRKIYRAIATSTDVEPGTDTTKWQTDPAASASALSLLTTDVEDNYTTSSDLTVLLAAKISATQSATNIAQAIEDSETTAGTTYATAVNLDSLESSIFADLINVSAWVGTSEGVTAVDYVAGNFVTHDGKLFKALAASTNVEPGTNATKWEQDTLTTADQVESAYAKSSDVSVLQSNIFNSMTGVADWSASPTYQVGDRVVYTETNGVKKLYKALIANSDTTPHDNISGSTPKWALDTLASALAVDSLTTFVDTDESITDYVAGQFTDKVGDLGNLTVAAKFNQYTTTANQTTATSNAVDAAYAAIFTEMTGLPDWVTGASYQAGDRVVHRETSTANRKVYKALINNQSVTPHDNITGSNPKWELDTLAFAGALSTLDATVNANGTGLVDKTDAIELRINNVGNVTMEQKFTAQATDIGDLESQYTVKIDSNGHVAGFGLANTTTASGANTSEFYINADRFAITPDLTGAAPAFVVGNSYSTGDFVTHSNKVWLFKFVNPSTHQAVSNYTVNHANLGPGGSSGSAAVLWEEAGQSPFVIQTDNVAATFDADGTLLTPFIPRGVYMNTARIKHASITAAKIGSVNADTISTGTLNVTGLIEANAIEASKLSIDNNFLAENASGELMLKTVSSNDGSGVKYENLSFDAVGVIAQTLQSGNATLSNQSFSPEQYTTSTPWSEYTIVSPYGNGATVTLPLLVEINIPASQLKESGSYYIDFGAQPFGSVSNSSSTSASMVILDVRRKLPSSSTYSYVTSRRGTLTKNSSLPLTYRNGAADVYLYQNYDYNLKLFGYIKGFDNHASDGSKGMYGGFIRVFKIHKST